jgi:hypothetical protein
VNHLVQMRIAYRPSQKNAEGDLAVKYSLPGRSQCDRFARPVAPDSSLEADMMSTFGLGQMLVRRSGYGAMQLAGPRAFGPPPDRASAIGVLQAPRESITSTRPSTTAPASSTI